AGFIFENCNEPLFVFFSFGTKGNNFPAQLNIRQTGVHFFHGEKFRAVFVTKRKMRKQISEGADVQFTRKQFRSLRTNAVEEFYFGIEKRSVQWFLISGKKVQ